LVGEFEQSQCGLTQAAFVGNLPFVAGFDELQTGQAQQCGWVRERPDDISSAFESPY
jgi:hypothetical protein